MRRPTHLSKSAKYVWIGTARIDRGELLLALFSEWSPLIALSSVGRLDGFIASRQGRLSTQFGPMSGTENAAVDLFAHALTKSCAQPVIADIPVHRESLLQVARHFGLRYIFSRLVVFTSLLTDLTSERYTIFSPDVSLTDRDSRAILPVWPVRLPIRTDSVHWRIRRHVRFIAEH